MIIGISRRSSVVTDPYFSSVKFLSGFEGADAATTLTEESSSARTVTFAGNAQIDNAQKKFGSTSLLLDGTGDIVTCPNSADFQFGSGSWTVEQWIRFHTLPTGGRGELAALYDQSSQRSWACCYRGSTLEWNILTSTDGTTGVISLAVSDTGVSSGASWYFIEFNYDGTNLRVFRDGVFKGKAAFSSTLFASTAKLSIGGIVNAGTPSADYIDGWIDETRITKGVCRNPSDSNYTPPTAAFPRS